MEKQRKGRERTLVRAAVGGGEEGEKGVQGYLPSLVDKQTENITFPRTSYVGGNDLEPECLTKN